MAPSADPSEASRVMLCRGRANTSTCRPRGRECRGRTAAVHAPPALGLRRLMVIVIAPGAAAPAPFPRSMTTEVCRSSRRPSADRARARCRALSSQPLTVGADTARPSRRGTCTPFRAPCGMRFPPPQAHLTTAPGPPVGSTVTDIAAVSPASLRFRRSPSPVPRHTPSGCPARAG